MIEQIVSNWVCWVILSVALAIYHIIFQDFLHVKQKLELRSGHWSELSSLLTAALPLLGLLGTIVGLLEAFNLMATGATDLLSAAIGDALFTTQLGLTCAVIAWLMQAYVSAMQKRLLSAETSQLQGKIIKRTDDMRDDVISESAVSHTPARAVA